MLYFLAFFFIGVPHYDQLVSPNYAYAFLVSGTGNGNAGNQPQRAITGSFQTDVNGNIVAGVADGFEGGTGISPYAKR